MGLFNNRSEGNYIKSYTIPSSCKDEKAHFDTSDHVQERVEPKPRDERKQRTKPALEVKPKTIQRPAPKVRPKVKQEPIQPATFGTPQNKGCLNMGKTGCLIIVFIAFAIKSCVEEVFNTFSSENNNDSEVIYDTTRYEFNPESEEYVIPEDSLDSIGVDDIAVE